MDKTPFIRKPYSTTNRLLHTTLFYLTILARFFKVQILTALLRWKATEERPKAALHKDRLISILRGFTHVIPFVLTFDPNKLQHKGRICWRCVKQDSRCAAIYRQIHGSSYAGVPCRPASILRSTISLFASISPSRHACGSLQYHKLGLLLVVGPMESFAISTSTSA